MRTIMVTVTHIITMITITIITRTIMRMITVTRTDTIMATLTTRRTTPRPGATPMRRSRAN